MIIELVKNNMCIYKKTVVASDRLMCSYKKTTEKQYPIVHVESLRA